MMTATEKVHMRYEDTELDEDSWSIVKEELKETEENRRKGLDILRKMLMDKEDLNPCLHEEFLLAFLRVTKYDCSKAYHRIIRYYEEKWNLPEIFKDYSPHSVKIVETARQAFASPYRMKDNSAILLVKRGDYDPSKIHYDLILRALSFLSDYLLQNPVNQMCGMTFILDLKSSSWSTWSEYTPARLKLVARLVQKCMALRIRGVHVINAPSIYYLLHSIVYPFLSTKIKNRIFLHKSCSSLHSYIAPELLPKEYAGDLEYSDLINIFGKLYENEEFFRKRSKFGFIKKKK